MNILVATHYFVPHTGGIEFVAHNQARGLAAAGHSVTVLTSSCGSRSASRAASTSPGVQVAA